MSIPKRLLALVIVSMSIILTACGGSTSGSSSSTTLTMWTWKLPHLPGLQQIAKNYEAKTGIKVKVNAYNPDDVYRTKISTAAQSGDLPDIISYWTGSQWDLAGSGVLSDITDKVDSSWQNQFMPGTYDKGSVFSQTQYDTCQKDPKCTYKNVQAGRAFSVPYASGQAMYIYANKSLLKEAGLSIDTPPQTAEDWLTMMETVKAKTGKAGVIAGAQNPNVMEFWLYRPLMMTSCGVQTYDAIYAGKDSFANPCSLKVLNWINQLSTEKLWTADVLQKDINPADQDFSQGKAAFDIGGTYTLSFLLSQGMKESDIVTFPVPALKGAALDHLSISADSLIEAGVAKNSPHQKEALDFLKYLTSQDQAEVFAKMVGDLPASKISSDPDKVGPVIPGLVKGLSADSPFIQSKVAPLLDTEKALDLGLQQFITGETNPAALAAKVDAANKAAWAAHSGA
ncbi:ABC transporter substrate-binding protein [Tengunoibacter tsumagoiensis]|uniref:ABC transporter substrate-binding protein n=1 Tax=Tengunoibacter tsumagoiensis TaxID=2014871 RepID=A0A402A4U0_9CHLR|nr:extracellular solute-binding protein [Tengunoibacter tsumagoiensis]GCE14025.1 hypothetical protein KTT_38840 [Tengunoibacter tsumagoiensis]